jgi:hypothetical protein
MTPVAAEGIKPSNTMGVERRLSTGQVFLTNQIVTLCGLDPSERLLPTVTTSDTNGAGIHGAGGLDLRTAVTLLPTPNATDGESGARNPDRAHNSQITMADWAKAVSEQKTATRRALNGASTQQLSIGGNQLWVDVPLPLPSQPDEMEGTA